MKLLLPGSHQQALDWMAMVHANTSPYASPVHVVLREEQLYGIDASEVDYFHQIGTYWENPAWGSASYRILMEEGLILHLHWAMNWTLDWQKAMNHRNPVSKEQIQTIRTNLQKLEQELSE